MFSESRRLRNPLGQAGRLCSLEASLGTSVVKKEGAFIWRFV